MTPHTPEREALTVTKIDETFTDRDGDDLRVETAGPAEFGAYIKTPDDGAYASRDDAPAVALAILRAAGFTDRTGGGNETPYFVARAVRNLTSYAANQARQAEAEAEKLAADKAAAEKADAEKLDAEALALWQASPGGRGDTRLPVAVRDKYRAIARAARALHNPEPDAAPVKPRFQVIDHDGDPYVVDNEKRRAWRFGLESTAREYLPKIVANQAWGFSKPFADYGIDQRTPSGRFALVTFKRSLYGAVDLYGIWDRDRSQVAAFGGTGRDLAARLLAEKGDGLSDYGLIWEPTAGLVDLEVI
ncbi:hypothetical protein SEA_MAGUCO_50 [Arthrobacter phage MaGuCo]|uniref:Uncharacterized protein n=1 Tax=Arthrobacter phage MaGuCo TaxID=3038363 RepID=A0AAF0GLQ0_9CAUD|nr:hypothetical protein SEA_MAGUCO_50 [Arthrobacter phage MaGuCo]